MTEKTPAGNVAGTSRGRGPHAEENSRVGDLPPGYEYYEPRLSRPVKWAIIVVVVVVVLALLWFLVFPGLQNLLPNVY